MDIINMSKKLNTWSLEERLANKIPNVENDTLLELIFYAAQQFL